MIDELLEAKEVVKPPQSFSTLSTLNAYESKKSHFIRHNRITYNSFAVLLTLVNHRIYTGGGMTVYGIIGTKDHCAYQSTYMKLDTLFKRGLIDCVKRSDGVNVFTPTDKAIEGINSLLIQD